MDLQDKRSSSVERKTGETDIRLDLVIDGQGRAAIDSGVPFLDHMLTLFTVHGFFDLSLSAKGDIEVDDHHTVEDIGICLGQALAKALADKAGINRYGSCLMPMDETLVQVVIDLSNRPFLHYQVVLADQKVGTFDTSLGKEFLRAFSQHAGITLHVDLLHGENCHHILEAVFKGLGRAIHQACRISDLIQGPLSSKGCL
jgi:imidazoleglycerol-phosphate dehydratase